jgi:hypothetical protein
MAKIFTAILQGAQETPPNASDASGRALVIWEAAGTRATYALTVAGIDFGPARGLPARTSDPADDVVSMHVHSQARGSAGTVVFGQINPAHDADDLQVLPLPGNVWAISGTWETTDPAATSIASFAAALNAAQVGADVPLYFNVHTAPFPTGEIRGQWVTTFDTDAYLSAYADVARAGIDGFLHYALFGWKEGRDVATSFDTERYLLAYRDVADAGFNPLEHYITFGKAEGRAIFEAVGRSIASGFDRDFYLLGNPDVGAASVDPQQHYRQSGWREARDPNAFFDTDAYLAANPDVAAAAQAGQIDPLTHYMLFGGREGRDPGGKFDTDAYLTTYVDVAQSGLNALDHYLRFGVYEGRQAFGDGVLD